MISSHRTMQMQRALNCLLWVTGLLWGGLISVPMAQAVRLADGTAQFAGLPQVLKVRTTDNQTWAWSATYFFTIKVPEDATEPLGRVVLEQTEGVDRIRFNLKRTYAYLNNDRQQRTPLFLTEGDRSLELRFAEPVVPGETVTLGVRPYRNPDTSGVYLFGITVFPEGEKVRSQFVGHGRLQFYDRSFFHRNFGRWH